MKLIDLTGQTFGRLTVISRAGINRHGRATWQCRCDCGTRMIAVGQDLRTAHTRSCGCLKLEVSRERGFASSKPDESISYDAAHKRIKAAKGRAAEFACVDCMSPARDWSLRHDAVVTHEGVTSRGDACRYSGDPNDYEPRCRPCHLVYDSLSRSGELLSDTPASGCANP